jgi:uncharacterized protein YutE (UPF0331/DUF86 family)
MINKSAILERLDLIQAYLKELENLKNIPEDEFLGKGLYSAAAESYLRRSLEAIFDIGRHILAKTGHIDFSTEYKSIAKGLQKEGIVDEKLGKKLFQMAGYRNRMEAMLKICKIIEIYIVIIYTNLLNIHPKITSCTLFLQ